MIFMFMDGKGIFESYHYYDDIFKTMYNNVLEEIRSSKNI